MDWTEPELREVASVLRRRHLRSFLAAWRETRQHLEAAQRSRSQRARLLHLARKHQLHFCLERLRPSGMTLLRGFYGILFHYDPTCTREYLEGQQWHLAEYRRQWRELRREPLDALLSNLRTLLEETDLVQETPLEVRWYLPDLYLEDVLIGDLEITLNLEQFRVHALNLSADITPRGGFQHPHVSSSGELCWNGYDEQARIYHQSGDFLALRDLIDNLLQTYNSHSPYITLEDWENGLGESCSQCGEFYDPDDLVYVESVGDSLCYHCRRYCERCDRDLLYSDYDPEWEMCSECLEEYTSYCGECEERFLCQELFSMEEQGQEGIEVILLCKACYEERCKNQQEENKEESSDEDWNDAESVLAAGVVVPADAE